MTSKPTPGSNDAVALRGAEDRPEAQQARSWDAEETVPVRAGSERKLAAERAERLRLVTGRGRR